MPRNPKSTLPVPQQTTEQKWTNKAVTQLLGKKIVNVRYMFKAEQKIMGWDHKALIIQLDDGSVWFPSSDDEGNDAGALHGQTKTGDPLGFPVI